MIATHIRDQARLRAQQHMDAALALIDELDEVELKDALRRRVRAMWTEANLAMSIAAELNKGGDDS